MDTNSFTPRIAACITCNRMVLIRDPTKTRPIDTFWCKPTFHIMVCSMCEKVGALPVNTSTKVYMDHFSVDAAYISAEMIKGTNMYMRACEIINATPNMGGINGRIPIVNRTSLITSFPDRTQMNYVWTGGTGTTSSAVQPYMITNFF